MNKRRLHHFWRKLNLVKASYFLLAAVIMLVLGVYALRQNNLTALRLRDSVIEADKQGTDVEKPLRELREYVYSHMNTDLSNGTGVQYPVQLKYRYDRLVAAEKAKTDVANGAIYTQAQVECERRFPAGLSGRGRIPCIEEYVSSHGVQQQPIPDTLYKFDFVAPRWSLDVAGISLLLSGLFFILFVVRFIAERITKRQLRKHR